MLRGKCWSGSSSAGQGLAARYEPQSGSVHPSECRRCILQARHGFVPERLGEVSTGQGGTGVFVPDTEAGSLPLPRGQYARFEGQGQR